MKRAHAHEPMPCGTTLETDGQNQRLRLGVVMLGASLVATVLLVQTGLHWAWRMLLFLPFFIAAFGAWQGLFRICPGMAFKGVRENVVGGEDRMGKLEDLKASRRMARIVLGGSTFTALFSTVVVMLLP